jgi:hypothetical protein
LGLGPVFGLGTGTGTGTVSLLVLGWLVIGLGVVGG